MENATFPIKLGAIATGHDNSAFSAVQRLFGSYKTYGHAAIRDG